MVFAYFFDKWLTCKVFWLLRTLDQYIKMWHVKHIFLVLIRAFYLEFIIFLAFLYHRRSILFFMKLKNKNSNQKVSTGKKGELVAERYLIKKGYEVLDKNYRKKVGEIDIICKKDDILHFVEVKTVKVPYPVELNLGIRPEDKLTKLKVGKIRTVGGMYIKERGLVGLEYKIDAIAVYLGYTNKILQRVQVKYIPAINV
ncbi:MAG: hypothetical protein RL094_151 [Candidatus Parcubacteria bacterium]